jgi:hypothetical protein
VGPDVPLTGDETLTLSQRVTVSGFTAAAIKLALSQAVQTGIRTVYFPAGTYTIESQIFVPGDVTLLGAGSNTVLKPATPFIQIFFAQGNHIRITRMKFIGPALTTWLQGDTQITARAIENYGYLNMRVDHNEIAGFAYACLFLSGATAQIEYNLIHDNRVIGLGYGVALDSGSSVLVTDNIMHDSRHNLASNDRTDTPKKSHWEFRHNKVYDNEPSINMKSALDTHPGFTGTFIVEDNLLERPSDAAIDILGGSGVIQRNDFNNSYAAITARIRASNGVIGTPHNIKASSNMISSTVSIKYGIEAGVKNFMADGVIQASTYDATLLPPSPMPLISIMDANGIIPPSTVWSNWW